MARLSPMAVDTITTRFLLLFVFLLSIPLCTLITFTVSLLANHLEAVSHEQINLSQNLFQEALADTENTLNLLTSQMRERASHRKMDCLGSNHLLCLRVNRDEGLVRSSNGEVVRLKQADLKPAYGQELGQKSFLARINGKLYLLRKSDPAGRPENVEIFYGLALDKSLLNGIYKRQTGLRTGIWLLSEDRQDKGKGWFASANAGQALQKPDDLLEILESVPLQQKADFVVELRQGSYQIAQQSLYSLDNRRIARVVHILPLGQSRLLLNNYYLGIYLIVVASLVFSVLLAMVAGRTITQPLLKLIDQVNTLSRENVMKEGDQVQISGVQEIRQLGEAFNRMILRLRQEHKMKDEFVATLTHDLKVPMLAEKQTLSYFLSETYGSLNNEQKEVLDALRSSNRSCLSLVNGLLEVYRYEAGDVSLMFESFSLLKLLDDTVGELRSLAREKSIQLEVRLEVEDTAETRVYADPLEIKRVLHNLISNAITNTPLHGRIECKITDAGHYGNETVYKVSSFQHTTLKHPVKLTDRLLVVIQDSGIGFSYDDLPYLFKQFAASKGRNPMSIGLGLFNCYQVLCAHHNPLWVESTEGEGSAVSFTLAQTGPAVKDRRVSRDRRRHP